MKKQIFSHTKIHWRQIILVIEFIALLIVAFVPQGQWNILVNTVISFVCSLQVESFRKFNGHLYASTMCTGNLRSATEHFYQYHLTKDKKTLFKSLQYFTIIFFFILGACLGAGMTMLFSTYAILTVNVFLLIVIFLMFIEQVH